LAINRKIALARRRKHNVKIIFPSTITTFSMIFGFISILLAADGRFVMACYMVMASILMDGLDGKVARMTHTASEFGIQYDSLSDLIAFGVAPCFIYARYFLYQRVTDQVYYLLPIMFLVCGAIRLARFNVTASIQGKSHFMGLPIPAAALALITVPIFHQWSQADPRFEAWGLAPYLAQEQVFHFSIVLIIALSWSMISHIKFDTPGAFWFRKYRFKPLNYLVLTFFLALNLVHYALFLAAVCLYYLLLMYGRAVFERIHHGEQELAEQEARQNPS